MGAIQSAKAHFALFRTRAIEVPEWAGDDGQPLIVYAAPMTLADKQKVQDYNERMGVMETLAQVLILKARDGEGKALFTVADKHALMHSVDPDVLARVVHEITRPRSVEELEKNSARTPSST